MFWKSQAVSYNVIGIGFVLDVCAFNEMFMVVGYYTCSNVVNHLISMEYVECKQL